MNVLAIETSCDETGVAIVRGEKTPEGFIFETRGAALLSQAALHAEYGGVYPTLAKREHEKNLPIMLAEALRPLRQAQGKQAQGKALKIAEERGTGAERREKEIWAEIDAIVVTAGPGLEPALWTGIEFAKKLAAEHALPLFPVNHMEGHLISSLAQQHTNKLEFVSMCRRVVADVKFPVLGLLVSGGHTEFVLMTDWFKYEIIGQTLDDAVGEAFDKVARMLGLGYPGGPHISRLAARARTDAERARNDAEKSPHKSASVRQSSALSLPRPMLHSGNCDVSFSGLKTAALYALRDLGGAEKLSDRERGAFAREFEDAVAEVLLSKTRRALEQTGAKTFVIGGGVAANSYLREKLQTLVAEEFPEVAFRLPELSITGDNAVMIAEAALVHLLMNDWQLTTDDQPEIRAQGRMPLAQKKRHRVVALFPL